MTLWHSLQIEAHAGGVNDLAFSHRNKQLCVITCGDDKTIKVLIMLDAFEYNKWKEVFQGFFIFH